jgi:thiamine transport system ATP-binding protein
MIVFEQVHLTLGRQTFDFDVRIKSGSVTMIVGASGSGKSTFLNLLAGFERPLSGSILIDDARVDALLPGQRPLSMVFQSNNLFAHLPVETNVALGIRPAMTFTAEERQTVSKALQDVGLAGFETRLPETLSGGEQQRVAFARALVRKKKILALDEPFAALDPAMREEMGSLLLTLHQREKNTIIMVTHNPDDVAALATDVILLADGRILFSGTKDAFLQHRDMSASSGLFAKRE